MTDRLCFISSHVYGYFNPEHGMTGGGAERQIYLLSTALSDRFDVHIVVGDYGQPVTEERDGVTLHRAYPLKPRQNIIQPARHFVLLGRAMRRANADIYIHRGAPDNTPFVYVWTRLLRSEFVYHVANDEHISTVPGSSSNPRRWLFRRALGGAAGVITQTPRQQRILRSDYGLPASTVPNGYPTDDGVRPHSQREYVLWVGRIEKSQKQPHVFLDIADRLPSVSFRLVGPADGDSEYSRAVVERASALENVTYRGELPPAEIHEQYRDAVALVNTSSHEGFPNTFLEAWRQGTPVVSLWTDPSRFMDDTVPSTYADGRVDDATEIVGKLATNAEYWNVVSENSRQYFEQNYDIAAVADEYESVLGDILTD